MTAQGVAGPAPAGLQRLRAAVAAPLQLVLDPMRGPLFVLVILNVSRIHQQYGFIAKLRPALLMTLMVAAYAYLNPRYLASGSVLRTWPAKVLIIIAVLSCLSVPFGISMGNSGQFILEVYSKNLIMTFLMIAAVRSLRDLFTLMAGYVIGSAILGYLSLFVFKLQKYTGDISYMRLSGLLTWDANDVGCVLGIGLPLTLLVMQCTRGRWRWFAFATVAAIVGTIARSGSRGGLLGMLLIGFCLLVLLRPANFAPKLGFVLVGAIAMTVWAPPGYWDQMSTILEPKDDYNFSSIDGRKAIATRGLGYMAQYPVFGVGIANFPRAECTISPKAKNAALNVGVKCTAPHNSYIQAGAEIGPIGLVLWTSIILGGFISMRRLGSRVPRSWYNGTPEQRFAFLLPQYLSIAVIGFGFTCFFLSFAWTEIYCLLVAFLACTLVHVNAMLDGTGESAGDAPLAPALPASGWRTHASALRTLAAEGGR